MDVPLKSIVIIISIQTVNLYIINLKIAVRLKLLPFVNSKLSLNPIALKILKFFDFKSINLLIQ